MNTKKKMALAYVRTAVKNEQSLSTQKQAIGEFAKNNGYEISDWVEHSGRSGMNPDFDWLYESLENNKEIDFILIYTADRLSRSASKLIALEKYLNEEYGVTVNVVKETLLPYFKTDEQNSFERLDQGQAANAFIQKIARLVSEQEDDYKETWTITNVQEGTNFYEVSQGGMTCCLNKQYGVTPKVGDELTIYTKGGRFGSIRGMDLNNQRIYWKTDAELEEQ